MANKSVDAALIVGRFNPITNGHCHVFDKTLDLADRTLVFFGSSQESATFRNPFNIRTRMELVEEVYEDEILRGRLILAPLPDMSNENDIPEDGAWGRYVMDHAKIYLHKIPDLMVYGNDDSRSKWFSKKDNIMCDEYIISRYRDPITATDVREDMLFDRRESWIKKTHPRIHKHYGKLRDELLSVPAYKQKFN